MAMADYNTAARLRQVMKRIAKSVLNEERPPYKYATVESVDVANQKANVVYPGETTSVTLPFGAIIPAVGDTVRIDGIPGDRHIVDTMSFHTHDGGGGDGHSHSFSVPNAADPCDVYPTGFSIGQTGTGDVQGYPSTYGTLTTFKDSVCRAYQIFSAKNGYAWYRTSNCGPWNDWIMITNLPDAGGMARALERQNAHGSGGGIMSWDGYTLTGTQRYLWLPVGAGTGAHFVLNATGTSAGNNAPWSIPNIGSWAMVFARLTDAQWAGTGVIYLTPADFSIQTYSAYVPHENDLVLGVHNADLGNKKFYLADGRVLSPGDTAANLAVLGDAGGSAPTIYRDLAIGGIDSSTVTGAIVIKANNLFDGSQRVMSILKLMIYNYVDGATIGDMVISGYWRSDGGNVNARSGWNCRGGLPVTQVRGGTDPSGNFCWVINDVADTWAYPKVAVNEWMGGYMFPNPAWAQGWTVDFVSDLTGYSLSTIPQET